MKYASEYLIKEHENILFGLKILDKMIYLYQNEMYVNIKDLRDMINFFHCFTDQYHNRKEESLLYPALKKTTTIKESDLAKKMMFEHSVGREYIENMNEYVRTNHFDKETFFNMALNYLNVMFLNIRMENSLLFPLCDRLIPVKEQLKLIDLFEEYEKSVLDYAIYEKLYEFEKKYIINE